MKVSRDPADVATALRQVQRKKPAKYRAVPVMVDGIRFASQAEARRYRQLSALQVAGQIQELELQPSFPVRAGYTSHVVCTYVADFMTDRCRVCERPLKEHTDSEVERCFAVEEDRRLRHFFTLDQDERRAELERRLAQ